MVLGCGRRRSRGETATFSSCSTTEVVILKLDDDDVVILAATTSPSNIFCDGNMYDGNIGLGLRRKQRSFLGEFVAKNQNDKN